MLAFEMLALFSNLTPCPLKFLGNSRAREKDKKVVPLSSQSLFYIVLLDSPILGRVSETA